LRGGRAAQVAREGGYWGKDSTDSAVKETVQGDRDGVSGANGHGGGYVGFTRTEAIASMRKFSQADLTPESLSAEIDGRAVAVAILPGMGSNLVSFQVEGREFIHFDAARILADPEAMTGAFQMFPTPCRLTGSRYSFGGKEIRQGKHGEEVSIHGLVRDEQFAVQKTDREIVSTLEIGEGHPVLEGFPFPGRMTTVHRLIAGGLELHFAFENLGDSPAPVGYGLHPFWRIPGKRSGVLVRIPTDNIMELVDLIPTGKLIPVAGTDYDWREWRSLEGVEIDAVFYPKDPQDTAGITFVDEGIRLVLQASANMRHMICYAPAGQPFVCLENLTCSPDDPNLYSNGFEAESGLAVVPPGEKWSGWIRYRVESV
jgi:aldose 1-epimerase